MTREMPAPQRCMILAIIFMVFLFFLLRSQNDVHQMKVRYGVMLDAGSTGSRIHVYQFAYSADGPQIMSEVFEQIKPGLSSFAGNPKAAAESLKPLIDVAKESIPLDEHHCTPLALKATAGLRLLPGTQAEDILEEVRSYLALSGFFIPSRAVEIMDGSDEGVYAWITVNFLSGRLGKKTKEPTVAIMDLGGGSTQIVFEPSDPKSLSQAPKENQYTLRFGMYTYKLYQHSYLGYGLMEARKKIKNLALSDSKSTHCLPNGFKEELTLLETTHLLEGKAGSHRDCDKEIVAILNKKKDCSHSSCSFNGVFQPPFSFFPDELFAFSYFYDRTETMTTPFPKALQVSSYSSEAERFCGKELEDERVSKVFQGNPHICLDLSFIHGLLKEGYGIPDSRTLQLSKKIRGYETGWCMGAMMKILDDYPNVC